jgi:hypothetical protein
MSQRAIARGACYFLLVWSCGSVASIRAGDCGCEAAPRACSCHRPMCYAHRCRHCCVDCQPPYGIVVPSAPAYAAPLVAAAPIYAAAAPVQMAPVNYAPSYAPQQAPSQCSSSQAAPNGRGTDQLEMLLRAALGLNGTSNGSAAPAAPSAPADTELADRLTKVESRVTELEAMSKQLGQIIVAHEQKLNKISQ